MALPQISNQLAPRQKAATSPRYSNAERKRQPISPPNAVARYKRLFPRGLIAPIFNWRTLRSHFHQTVKTAAGKHMQPNSIYTPALNRKRSERISATIYATTNAIAYATKTACKDQTQRRSAAATKPRNTDATSTSRRPAHAKSLLQTYQTDYKNSRVLIKTRRRKATTNSTKKKGTIRSHQQARENRHHLWCQTMSDC